MKILFYINAIHHGGAERVMCNLATRFSEAGNECILLTSFRDTWEYMHGDRVRRLTLFETMPDLNFFSRNFVLVKRLRAVLKQEKPDVLISFMAEPNFRAIVASIGLKNKVIVSVRNDPDREYPGRITRFLAKTLFRFADGIVFQTEDAKEWFPKAIRKKSAIIYNQVDEVFFQTEYTGERHDIVTTGRLTAQKNHELLIRAFAQIADNIPENLIIYGEGELRGKLESLVTQLHMEHRVFLPGSVKDVAGTIKSAKLFVLSSDYEGMPNSLMEAMALGLPCISTDCPCGGPRMLLQSAGEKCLIPVGDLKQLAGKLFCFLTDENRRIHAGNEMKQYAMLFHPLEICKAWDEYTAAVVG